MKNGFSLLEILIVLGILSILGSVGVANFAGFRNQNQLELTGREIAALLRNTQSRAIAQEGGAAWGVHFVNDEAGGRHYYQTFTGPSYTEEAVVSSKPLDGRLMFYEPEADSTLTVLFAQLSGSAGSASTTVVVQLRSDATASTTVVVWPNGLIEHN